MFFEYSLGELFEEPYASNLIELDPTINEEQFLAKLIIFLLPYMKKPVQEVIKNKKMFGKQAE